MTAAMVLPGPAAPETATRPLLEIDTAAVAANTRLFARRTDADLMAVVKANGFGHGSVEVARTALAHGARWLGVTSLDEALVLRRAGIGAPVLSWLNPVDLDAPAAARHRVDLAVPSLEHLNRVVAGAARAGRRVRVHLHLDTGMARDGAPPDDWPRLFARARDAERADLVEVVGVMGHLPCADRPGDPTTRSGRRALLRGFALARAAGLRPGLRHLAATAAALTDGTTHLDLVRVGAGLVGIDPSGTTVLNPALRLTAPVVQVREVPAGTGIGYGHSDVTDRPTRLGLIPIGYADGLPRVASGRAEVLVGGRRRRLRGRISMDQAVVDLGADPVHPGTGAVVFGPGHEGEPTVEDWARWSDTIPHEIVTGLGPRLLRTTL
ncbi:alanine racemase [Nocardiopsis protaetiae]|uniref:alanine racemase n=1 Tax=Nocardiopsis protaetiae TaxID=3382270 RepID=UPI00387AEC40